MASRMGANTTTRPLDRILGVVGPNQSTLGNAMKIEIVINACYGGFSLSNAAIKRMVELQHAASIAQFNDAALKWLGRGKGSWRPQVDRTDPILIHVVRELGSERASGECSKLEIETIYFNPEDRIHEHDGYESIR